MDDVEWEFGRRSTFKDAHVYILRQMEKGYHRKLRCVMESTRVGKETFFYFFFLSHLDFKATTT